MCNPAAIGIGLMLAGTAASAVGQRQAGKAQKRELARTLARTEAARKKSLGLASEVADQQAPANLAREIQAEQEPVRRATDQNAALAQTFGEQAAPTAGGASAGAYTGAAQAALRDASAATAPEAQRRGFANALANRADAMKRLAWDQQSIGIDVQRDMARLGDRLQRAGRKGRGLRLAGGLASTVGGGVTNYGAWLPAAQTATMGDSGEADLYGPRRDPQTGAMQA